MSKPEVLLLTVKECDVWSTAMCISTSGHLFLLMTMSHEAEGPAGELSQLGCPCVSHAVPESAVSSVSRDPPPSCPCPVPEVLL